MKRTILVLISVLFLSACYSTSPLTFKGETKYWHIEMAATNGNSNEQKISVTYKYKGTMEELKKFKYLELSFDAVVAGGSKTINAKNGLTQKEFTIRVGGNGPKITNKSEPTATILLGENGIKETTKLVYK